MTVPPAAARAGASVSMLGAVGTDAAGDDLLQGMAANGVNTTHVARVESSATGTALIAVDSAGSNSIAVAEGANFQIDPDAVARAVADLKPVAVIGQREVPDEAILAAFAAASPGLRVLNVSPVDDGEAVNLSQVDIAVVDPPRTGMDPRVLRAVAGSAPSRIVYLSCEPSTLARDAGLLQEEGYRVERLELFDFFPQTYHIENLALFRRGEPS